MSDIKTLRVILSNELPLLRDRESNIIYFLYDKLLVFIGQNLYSDPYAIVEHMPDKPVFGILYFVLNDGTVKSYINYTVTEVAEIENSEQLEILKQAGTTFFVNAQRRYLDLNRRIITLPYKNGTYELTMSLANDLIIDKNTIIAFNPETNEFELAGDTIDPDNIDFIKRGFTSKDSNTIKTTLTDHTIQSEVKLSKEADNVLSVQYDGLYAGIGDKVTKEEYDKHVEEYNYNTKLIKEFLDNLDSEMADTKGSISSEAISNRIREILKEYYPEIDTNLSNYDHMNSQFKSMEARANNYTDAKYIEEHEQLTNMVSKYATDPWDNYEADITDDSDIVIPEC